jgi:ATP-dependent HslUV protease ATP-binding subunit HslU
VGKTEIARRMAGLIDAPFLKVEATKFTEIGYVGSDVQSIIRNLVKNTVSDRENRARERVLPDAQRHARERVLDILMRQATVPDAPAPDRADLERRLAEGGLDGREIEIEVERPALPMMEVLSNQGMEEMGMELQSIFENAAPRSRKRQRATVGEALRRLAAEEAEKLINHEEIVRDAVEAVEEGGIVFIDEIDKIARREDGHRDIDVSREGVQRDLLPLVDGTAVVTRYGTIRTDYILFIAAGAFHSTKPSDLMPELQGRFPIRVELDPLTRADLERILREPHNALVKQYAALLGTEQVALAFTDEAIARLAGLAADLNAATVNIGARRLYTIMEKLLEDISFRAPELAGTAVTVDRAMVEDRLAALVAREDLSRYIL